MALPGFKRDPIREELRRLSRESCRLGQTARRLVEEAAQPPPRPSIGSHQPSTGSIKRDPILKVEGRLARRKVLLAAGLAALLAWILYRLLSSPSA